MSVTTTHTLRCDHRESDRRCDDSASTTRASLQAFLAFAAAVGWLIAGDDDHYCPRHAAEHSV